MMKRLGTSIVGWLSLCLLAAPSLAVDTMVLWQRNFERQAFYDIVQNAAELTKAEFGDYQILPSDAMEQGRAFANLATGDGLNLAIGGSTPEREAQVDAIYVPVDRGLLGFRICLTNKTHPTFSNINTVADFKSTRQLIGVGSHWPDKKIMDSNGLRLVDSPVYESLFRMLSRGRFDCFARSLNELDRELAEHADQGFVVEPYVAFVYAYADFLFVSKSAPRIKQRLEKGMQMALEDGSFYRIFDKHYLDVMRKYQFYNRKLLFLKNPLLSEKAKSAINQYGIASFSNGY